MKRIGPHLPECALFTYLNLWSDAYIISFPKCGRTWLRVMIGRAFCSHFNLSYEEVSDLTHLTHLHPDVPRLLFTHDGQAFYQRPEDLRTNKRKFRGQRVVLLVRDPRDVVVSSYFQKRYREHIYDADITSYVYEDVGSLATIQRYYTIWADNAHHPAELLLIRFEDLHADPGHELQRLMSFLGIALSPNHVIDAVEFSSFRNMRRIEHGAGQASSRMRPGKVDDHRTYKTRKGQPGDFVNHLDPREIAYMNDQLRRGFPAYYRYEFG